MDIIQTYNEITDTFLFVREHLREIDEVLQYFAEGGDSKYANKYEEHEFVPDFTYVRGVVEATIKKLDASQPLLNTIHNLLQKRRHDD